MIRTSWLSGHQQKIKKADIIVNLSILFRQSSINGDDADVLPPSL